MIEAREGSQGTEEEVEAIKMPEIINGPDGG